MELTERERARGEVIALVAAKQTKRSKAAQLLGVSVRQIGRLVRAWRGKGDAGMVSGHRGKLSNNRISEEKQQEIEKLLRGHYHDFGPTLASEKLWERHGIRVSRETVRQTFIRLDLWKPKCRKLAKTHPMRERLARFGDLIQIDGSPHDWFEGRADRCTLIVFIDDATSKITKMRFYPTETTEAYMRTLEAHLQEFGRPVALYSDRHSIFRDNSKQEGDTPALTQFGRAVKSLGIEHIHARSPQAKGRVERANQTLQDRLVREMRLRNINDMESANRFLDEFRETLNGRFAVAPSSSENAHRPLQHAPEELSLILANQHERTLSNNLSLQYNNTIYQVITNGIGYAMRKAKVTVCERLDGSIVLLYKEKQLEYTTFAKGQRPASPASSKEVNQRVEQAIEAQKDAGKQPVALPRKAPPYKPASNHPWRLKNRTFPATPNRQPVPPA